MDARILHAVPEEEEEKKKEVWWRRRRCGGGSMPCIMSKDVIISSIMPCGYISDIRR